MRKYKKSTWLPVALFIYTTIMAVYFIPRNTEIGNAEKICHYRGILSYYCFALDCSS